MLTIILQMSGIWSRIIIPEKNSQEKNQIIEIDLKITKVMEQASKKHLSTNMNKIWKKNINSVETNENIKKEINVTYEKYNLVF
jgi:hypothetical protein